MQPDMSLQGAHKAAATNTLRHRKAIPRMLVMTTLSVVWRLAYVIQLKTLVIRSVLATRAFYKQAGKNCGTVSTGWFIWKTSVLWNTCQIFAYHCDRVLTTERNTTSTKKMGKRRKNGWSCNRTPSARFHGVDRGSFNSLPNRIHQKSSKIKTAPKELHSTQQAHDINTATCSGVIKRQTVAYLRFPGQ